MENKPMKEEITSVEESNISGGVSDEKFRFLHLDYGGPRPWGHKKLPLSSPTDDDILKKFKPKLEKELIPNEPTNKETSDK